MKAIWQTVLLLALSLFLAEAGIMLILELMDHFDLHVPAALLPWIDASLLVLLASPAIFYWVLRPQIASERAKSRMLLLMSHDDVTAPRRHRCAKVGLRGSTKESGHVGDYHGRARPGEECVSGARG